MKTGGRVAATGSVVSQRISTGSSVAVTRCVGIECMKTDGRIRSGIWSEAEEGVLSLGGIETRITAVRRRDYRLRWMQTREAGEQRSKDQRECIRFHRRGFCLFCSAQQCKNWPLGLRSVYPKPDRRGERRAISELSVRCSDGLSARNVLRSKTGVADRRSLENRRSDSVPTTRFSL